ncbi:unnamed protein product [Mytilus coruscus]|uniref:Uncharacterized protein n=1 Tax=Mytilus coruscus TaxID=42192 RepID=A0A6J8ARV2_MYTCO|nr:unnamed protein product [Mytilus coruscus]
MKHTQTKKETPLGYCPRVEEEQPTIEFETKEPTKYKKVKEVCEVKKGKNRISTSQWCTIQSLQKCPKILRKLWQLFRTLWKKEPFLKAGRRQKDASYQKKKIQKDISQFRTISLLSVEGKIYFSVLANRMTKYMVENSYIDTSMQKGGIAGFSGCVEHTSVLSQLIHEAKTGKKNLAVVWLDLANAYGSVPHKLIDMAMDHYHIPEHIRR